VLRNLPLGDCMIVNVGANVVCVEALQEALARYGKPKIFNTDQGSQFTSVDFTNILDQHGILN
jgi:transposase InsO family protein